MNKDNYIITIGRQLGSGGASMGKMIAAHFGFRYVDREILIKASEQLHIPHENLEWIEEKNFSIWGAFLQANVYDMQYVPEEWYMPTSRQLFETQTRIIEKMADESSCVVVGRCGSYLFENHPNHASLFLHAGLKNRMERLEQSGKMELFGTDAKKAIEKEDKDRGRYYNAYTGRKWLDLTNYDLCIDTGSVGHEAQVKETIINYLYLRFPELKK